MTYLCILWRVQTWCLEGNQKTGFTFSYNFITKESERQKNDYCERNTAFGLHIGYLFASATSFV